MNGEIEMTKMDELQLVRIARVKDAWQANLLRSELEASGIQAQTNGDQLSNWQIGIPADVSVLVREQDRIRASAITDQFLAAMTQGKMKTTADHEPATTSDSSVANSLWFRGYLALELVGLIATVWAVQGNHLVLAGVLLLAGIVVSAAYWLSRRLLG